MLPQGGEGGAKATPPQGGLPERGRREFGSLLHKALRFAKILGGSRNDDLRPLLAVVISRWSSPMIVIHHCVHRQPSLAAKGKGHVGHCHVMTGQDWYSGHGAGTVLTLVHRPLCGSASAFSTTPAREGHGPCATQVHSPVLTTLTLSLGTAIRRRCGRRPATTVDD